MIASRLVVALALIVAAVSAGAAERIEMTVTRDNEPIGTHSFSFVRDGAQLHVDTRVEIAVQIAFITVYRMLKVSRETWEGDYVVAYDATIDDNGTVTTITMRTDGKDLVIDGPAGRVTAPLGTMISGYWSEATVGHKLLVDSSDGVLRRVSVAKAGRETLRAGGSKIAARRYRMTGDLTRELWYGTDGRLVRMREIARDGSVIVTELTAFNRKD